MGPGNNFKLSRILLAAAILLIVAFQGYWLNKLYHEQWTVLQKDTDGILRDVVYDMQLARYKNDTLVEKQKKGNNLFALNVVNQLRRQSAEIRLKKDSTRKDSGVTVRAEPVLHAGADSAGNMVFTRSRNILPERVVVGHQIVGSPVKLPPAVDTALLRRMSQSGLRVIVSYNLKKTDSSEAGPETVLPATNALLRHPVQIVSRKVPGLSATKFIRGEPAISISSEKAIFRMMVGGKPLDDTLKLHQLDSIYRKELSKSGIPLTFAIRKGKADSIHWKDTLSDAKLATHPASVGLLKQYWYQAVFENPTMFVLKRISLQILFSLFLVAFTSVAFLFLYRNLVAQRKLTEMKNDFISNITHELKTPLATVSVAVEALRSFGAIENPVRTREYLDISASELQRLSLLVDKVLKLSLFENRELELKMETLDLRQVTEEVLSTMKLQFDTHHAKLELEISGNYFLVHADRLHLTSVIFNLLDNALKYSKEDPSIIVRLKHETDTVLLEVEDNGIGIPADYRARIFDKFFRVPSGDHHNIKGYGLGLSYVAHVIKRHNGSITVESEKDKGSKFTIKLPVT